MSRLVLFRIRRNGKYQITAQDNFSNEQPEREFIAEWLVPEEQVRVLTREDTPVVTRTFGTLEEGERWLRERGGIPAAEHAPS